MPCWTDPGPEREYHTEEIKKRAETVATLENLLCGICTRVEATKPDLIADDQVLTKWWAAHKLKDQKRKAAETAKKEQKKLADRAKAKLTKEELEALGIR